MITIEPGTFIVLEGLDATGKSTQLERIQEACPRLLTNETVYFTHQPSGGSAVGNAVYAVTEHGDIASPWARQFLHLASHAEHYHRDILPTLEQDGVVFMDRCWWSTVAYGYWGASMLSQGFNPEDFLYIAQIPAKSRIPDMVFVFLSPHQEDRHNTPEVEYGYEWLLHKYPNTSVLVPPGMTVEETTLFLFRALCEAGLATATP